MKNKILIIICAVLLIFIGVFIGLKVWIKHNLTEQQVAVLVYHNILDNNITTTDPDAISINSFEQQMKYLKDKKYTSLTLDQLYCWKEKKCHIPSKSVVLTFDDGFYNYYYLVRPILKKYGYHGVIFIIGSITGKITKPFNPNEYGTIGMDVISQKDNILEYQSHTYNMHSLIKGRPKILYATYQDLEGDLEAMKRLMHPNYLAYPYYVQTKSLRDLLKKYNYKLAFVGENEKVIRSANNYEIPRIEVGSDFNQFKKVFETQQYNNRYGSGLLRKIFINIERHFHITL